LRPKPKARRGADGDGIFGGHWCFVAIIVIITEQIRGNGCAWCTRVFGAEVVALVETLSVSRAGQLDKTALMRDRTIGRLECVQALNWMLEGSGCCDIIDQANALSNMISSLAIIQARVCLRILRI
jgi:hypothetical protein